MSARDPAVRRAAPPHRRPGTIVVILSGLAVAAALATSITSLWFVAAAGAAYSLAASP